MHALHYTLQHALDERIGTRGVGETTRLSHVAQKAYIETLTEAMHTVGKKPQSNMRIQDLIRKNEARERRTQQLINQYLLQYIGSAG